MDIGCICTWGRAWGSGDMAEHGTERTLLPQDSMEVLSGSLLWGFIESSLCHSSNLCLQSVFLKHILVLIKQYLKHIKKNRLLVAQIYVATWTCGFDT